MLIFTADIGGTNARFALFLYRNKTLQLKKIVWLPSAEMNSFTELYLTLCEKYPLFTSEELQYGAIAAAGMIQSPTYLKLSNLKWAVDTQHAEQNIAHFPKVLLINDFAAQAWACLSDISSSFTLLFAGKNSHNENTKPLLPLTIMGAGTGLGYATLLENNGQALLVNSEAGHQAFPFLVEQEREREFSAFLCKQKGLDYPRGDDVLTGSGLTYLHWFLTGDKLEPKEIPSNSLTFQYFSLWYARAARDFCLVFLPKSLVITGGIAAKHKEIFDNTFYKEFISSKVHSSYLQSVSIYLNSHEDAALYGATIPLLQLLP